MHLYNLEAFLMFSDYVNMDASAGGRFPLSTGPGKLDRDFT
jgi:hypothetical protein